MKDVWDKIYGFLKRTKGMTMVETMVALGVVAVFATGITGTVVTINAASAKSDVASYFDRQNQMAIAEFKTNPDPEYLKTKEPFNGMFYSPASVSFNQHYDKSFQPTSATDAPYYVSYQYKPKTENTGFSTMGTGVVMEIANQRRLSDGTYEDIQTSAAQGTGMIHALRMTNTEDDPIPAPTLPSADTSYRVSFIIEGGTFKDEERGKRTVVVDKGTPLSTILPKADELQAADTGFPIRFTGWKKTGTTEAIPADANLTVTTDLSISGAFEGIPCTVTFAIPYYNGSWSNNAAGVSVSYQSQQGVKVDRDALAQSFGRKNFQDLFTGNVIFGGWFDSSGNEIKTGLNGTVLADDWDGKTVTAKVTVPSVTIKMSVSEGGAAGIYSLNAPIGGTISKADIAAAVGKDYSEIETIGDRVLSGWKRQDNGADFVPGITEFTSEWENSVIVTQYGNRFGANGDMNFNANIDGRSFWDISDTTLGFIQSDGMLWLKVKENPTKVNTPAAVTGVKYYLLGYVSDFKKQIKNPGGDISINLNMQYQYVPVQELLTKYPDKKLYFNNNVDQSVTAKFNGQGAAFAFDSSAVAELKNILGFTGKLELKPVFTPVKETVPTAETVREKKKLGMYLELGAVSPKGRKDNEKYKLQFLRSDPGQLADGTYVYKMGIIGENGDNILDETKKMSPEAFLGGGKLIYPESAGIGTDNLVLGSMGGPKYSDIGSIDQLLLVVKTDSMQGAGFRIEFDTKGPQSNPNWIPAGKNQCYMKRQFDNVKVMPDSVVRVKHLTVYVWKGWPEIELGLVNEENHSDKSRSFDNLKPVNEGNAYGSSYLGHTFYGGWVEENWVTYNETVSHRGALTYGWPINDTNRTGLTNMSTGKTAMVDGPISVPLPSGFEIE